MRGSRNSIQRDQTFTTFFFSFFVFVFFRCGEPKIAKSGPSLARQRNAISMAFRWRANVGPTLNAGLVASWLIRGSGLEC